MEPVVIQVVEPIVFSADPYVLAFIKGNLVSIGIVLALFGGFSKITKWKGDDKISRVLNGVWSTVRPGKKKQEMNLPKKQNLQKRNLNLQKRNPNLQNNSKNPQNDLFPP